MGDKWKVCAVFSVAATIALSALGLALIYGYDYLPISGVDMTDAGLTCIYAAMIYALIAGVAFYISSLRRPHVILTPPTQLLEMQSAVTSTPHLEIGIET